MFSQQFPDTEEVSLPFSALIGCFSVDPLHNSAPHTHETSAHCCKSENGDWVCLYCTVHCVLRQLLSAGDAQSAKREVENYVNAMSELKWRQRMPHKYSATVEELQLVQFLRELTGVLHHTTSGRGNLKNVSPSSLPPRLLYVLYYMASVHCVPNHTERQPSSSVWASLFFAELCKDSDSPHVIFKRRGEVETEVLRRNVSFLFSDIFNDREGTFVLTFLDAFNAWILQDYHVVISLTEKLLSFTTTTDSYAMRVKVESKVKWLSLMRNVSLFIHACCIIATTNISHEAARQDVYAQLCRVGFWVQSKETMDNLTLSMTAEIRAIMRREVCTMDLINEHNEMDNNACSSYNLLENTTTFKSNHHNFYLALSAWLRSKRLTDSGQMTTSRDFLILTLNKLQADTRHPSVPFFWLRQLLLVNCAALADTVTLLNTLYDWDNDMRLSEVLFIASCPTLAVGGVHSPLLAWNHSGDTREFVRSLRKLPLPVQIPLLSHHLWQLRQCAPETSDRRIELQNEMLYICGALVSRARGLVGSLALSCTDCAPHRVLFDAITLACDVQEDLLRDATLLFYNDTTNSTPRRSSCIEEPISHLKDEADAKREENVEMAEEGIESELCVSHIFMDQDEDPMNETNNNWLVLNPNWPPSFKEDEDEEEIEEINDISSVNIDCCEDDNNRNDQTDDKDNTSSSLSSISYLRCDLSLLSFEFSSSESMQELYWRAHKEAARWMDLLERSYPHLTLILRICHLRTVAAAFDKSTTQLTQQLLSPFKGNVLAAAHGARALFASLCVVSAERRICKALQLHPHSAEVQRLHRFMCTYDMPEYDTEKMEKSRKKRIPDTIYVERYRGLLPVRYAIRTTISNADGSQDSWSSRFVPLVVVFIEVVFLLWSFVLHVLHVTLPGAVFITFPAMGHMNSMLRNNTADVSSSDLMDGDSRILDAGPYFLSELYWSFVLPCALPLYFGVCNTLYALVATFLNSRTSIANGELHVFGKKYENRIHTSSYFIRSLMLQGGFLSDTTNCLTFCLRGIALVNLLTGIQLVVTNLIHLNTFSEQMCHALRDLNRDNETLMAVLDSGSCGRVLTVWGSMCVFLLIILLFLCVLTHSRAWRVLRSGDVITGSLATFFTIFVIDLTIFILTFPVLVLCCAVLEPLLFGISLLFSFVSSPLLVWRFPSIPSDALLPTFSQWESNNGNFKKNATNQKTLMLGGENVSLNVFCKCAVKELMQRLHRSLPPQKWSVVRLHDFPLVCVHDLCIPPNSLHNPCCTCQAPRNVQLVVSRMIGWYLKLHRAVWWRTHRSPLCSAASVQLALLQEAFAAVTLPTPCSVECKVDGLPLGGDCKPSRRQTSSGAAPYEREAFDFGQAKTETPSSPIKWKPFDTAPFG